VVCDLATSGVAAARQLGAVLAEAGVPFVDAPVSGSVPAVEAGTLLVMAGGDPAAIAVAEPVLAAFASRVVRVGDVAAGQAMKLAVNLVVHDLNAALSEALILAEHAGITRETAYDVLADSVVAAPYVRYKRAAFLDPATPVAMSLDLVRKDLRLIAELAADVGVAIAVTTAAEVVVDAACEAGHGSEDMAALSRFRQVRPLS
jgi:3-hydroxyisobutyrate dehydrogenase-like beta-hydroxyacid dehydrogenase